ncbi:MAG: hypothetical protein O7D93_09080 [Acidobacteria bacterium]|nr:hypothetical protein [Acidobacteriota bacterium]
MKRLKLCFWIILAIGSLSVFGFSQGNKFRSDDPLAADPDQLSIPQPDSVELSQTMDILENTFALRPQKDVPIATAENVNTLGEVPDSSWFTNRMSQRVMTIEELVRGPNQVDGPDRSVPWVIIAVKSEGITPGFTIRDGRDDVYFIKFDPPKYPQLATSTEVISTKFFHAFGYHVPENYLSFIRREELRIAPEARLEDDEGKERPVRESDIDRIFKWAFQHPDGTTPVIASRRLPGTPIGHFQYHGTRSDDPNDIFPHENRRELRGLRVFSAWLNHDDSRSINSLDMYLGSPGEGHVQHHLIDFGSCLGSGSVKPQTRRAGNEYILEGKPIVKAGLSLGIWDRPWRHVKFPDYPAIGRFEADFFQPQLWRPEYPNPAFERMQIEDAFWATRTILRFSDEMIRAIVETGQISDLDASNFLVETLIKRRDKIIRYYLARINPLDAFQVTGRTGPSLSLEFKNLGLEAGLASRSSYQYQWFRFDNQLQSLEPLGQISSSTEPSLALVQDRAAYLMVRISTLVSEQPNWKKKVEVFIRNDPQNPTVVGVDRES